MTGSPNKFSRFWQELKDRKTDRVIVAYAAAAFAILQLSEILSDRLSFPEGTMNLIIIILAVGFPVAAILSWFFDITPSGIEKTKPAGERVKHKTDTEVRKWKRTTLISFIIIIILLLYNITTSFFGRDHISEVRSIAVQPFRCLNEDSDLRLQSAMFTYMINGTLTSLEDITLKTWPPSLSYQEDEPSYPEIGRKLGISYLLRGTLAKFTSKIIFVVQLIRINNQSLAWGKGYELDTLGEKLAEIQTDIAINVAGALKAELSAREKNRISKKPSMNSAAFRNYVEGSTFTQQIIFNVASGKRIFEEVAVSHDFKNAIRSFDEAIRNDSAFALAYAKRAIIRSWAYFHEEEDKTAIEKCKADIDRAFELDEDLVEAKIALGFYYYYCKFDYRKALNSFNEANSQQPNNWQCLYYMALVHRALGNWHKSQKIFTEVLEFNPQDPLVLTNIGMSEAMLRNYDEAISYHNKAIKLAPNWRAPYANKIDGIILRDGKTAEARKVLDTATLMTGDNLRKYRIRFDIYDQNYQDALHQIELSEPSDFDNDRGIRMLTYAEIYRYLGNNNTAVTFYKSALMYFQQELAKESDNCGDLAALGIAYAGLSNKREAVVAGLKAVELGKNNTVRLDARTQDLAKIYIMLGEYDKAVEQLEFLLNNPSTMSVKLLQLDPVWKPLYENARFKNLTKII